jgi:hypothetical protein
VSFVYCETARAEQPYWMCPDLGQFAPECAEIDDNSNIVVNSVYFKLSNGILATLSQTLSHALMHLTKGVGPWLPYMR